MPSTSQLAEALESPTLVPDLLSGIVGDAGLTPAEKSLMIEALFVHDAPETSLPGSGAGEQTAAARRALARRRRARERVRTGLKWGATLGAGLVGVLFGQFRR
jgi:hypothetical protein